MRCQSQRKIGGCSLETKDGWCRNRRDLSKGNMVTLIPTKTKILFDDFPDKEYIRAWQAGKLTHLISYFSISGQIQSGYVTWWCHSDLIWKIPSESRNWVAIKLTKKGFYVHIVMLISEAKEFILPESIKKFLHTNLVIIVIAQWKAPSLWQL